MESLHDTPAKVSLGCRFSLLFDRVKRQCCFFVGMLAASSALGASTASWNVDASGTWSTTSDWNPAAAPGNAAGDVVGLVFNITAARTITIDNTSRTVGTLNIGDSGSSYFGYILTNSGGATLTFDNNGSGANLFQTTTTAADTISVPIVLFDNLTVSNTSTLNVSGPISGNSTITKSGAGLLTLTGSNSYASTVISQGTIRSGTINSTKGAITLGDPLTSTNNVGWLFAGSTAPSNAIVIANSGSGTVTIGTYSSGLFTTHTGILTLNRPVTFFDATGDRTSFTGKISGSVGLITISGTRVTFDNPNNDFVGNILINSGGSFQNNSVTALPSNTSVTVTGAFILNDGGTNAIDALNGSGSVSIISSGAATLSVGNAGGSGTFSGVIQNGAAALSLIKNGSGIQTLSGSNTFTGGTTLNSGTLTMGTNNVFADTGALVMNGGTFSNAGFSDSLGTLVLQSDSTIVLGTNTTGVLTFSNGSYASGVLTISNWAGADGTSGLANRIFISADPGTTFLAKINFAGYQTGATRLGTGEIVPSTTVETKLAITSINSGSLPVAGTPFSAVVEAQDIYGDKRTVASDTGVMLTLSNGGGMLGGTLTGTILAGTSSVVLNGITYTKAESAVVLTATRTSGDTLTAGNSDPFTVKPGSLAKLQVLLPGETGAPGTPSGKTGTPAAQYLANAFNLTVNAVDSNWNVVNTNDTVAITSSDSAATLPANTALIAGTKVLSVALNTRGTATVTASDVTNPAVIANSTPSITVNGDNGNWAVDASGNWSTVADWTPCVSGNAAGDIVGLNFDITAARTVTLDTTSRIMGTLNIGDSGVSYFAYTLAAIGGATLTFNNNGSTANLVQTGTTASDTISAPIILSDNLAISNNSTLTLSGGISGNENIIKSGKGVLILSSSNNYAGTTISAGTIRSTIVNSTKGTIILGDANTGTNNASWLFAGGTSPTNPIVVASSGSGVVTIGTYSGPFVSPSQPMSLNRPVTFTDATGDRTSFVGKISGSVGTITISGSRVTFANTTNDFVGNVVINSGSIYQSDTATALPITTSITNNGTFRINNGGTHTIDALTGGGSVFIIAGGAAVLSVGNSGGSGLCSGIISDGASPLGLIKTGGGIETLNGTNTFTGGTTVSNGTLIINGSLGTGSVTVKNTSTLAGVGTIKGPVSIQSLANLQPGTSTTDTSTLAISNTLSLAGTAVFALNRTNSQNSSRVSGITTVTYGGTLTVVNFGPPLVFGDTFTLFNAGAYNSKFSATNLPALTGSLLWDTTQLSVNGSITVVKSSQTISFAPLTDRTYGDATFGLSATASSGLPVTFSIISGPATISSGTSVTITGAGTVVVRASQTGDANYYAAPNIDRTFAVSQAALTVTANSTNRIYAAMNPTFSGTVTGLKYSDNITVIFSTSATTTTPVGTYAIVPTLSDPAAKLGNYVVTTNAGILTVNAATLTGTADNKSRECKQVNPVFTVTYSGFVNGETSSIVTGTLNGSTTATISSPTGTYPINVSGQTAPNYTINYTAGTLTIVDTTAPNVTLNGSTPVTVECHAAYVEQGATANDSCAGALTVSTTGNVNTNALGYYTVTYSATDPSGNSSSATRVVHVVDTTIPAVTLNGNSSVTVECHSAYVEAGATANDTCSGNLSIVTTGTVDTNNVGNYTLTYSATDASGNASSATRVVHVVDSTAPLITGVPADVTVRCDVVPAAASATTTDACDSNPQLAFSETRTNGACSNAYTLTRTWTATDVAGNSSSKTQTITVIDTTAPIISGVPADVTVTCDAIPAAATPSISDNCDSSATLSFTETSTQTASGCGHNQFQITRTWTAHDASGNSSSVTQHIAVSAQPLAITGFPADATYHCANLVPSADDSLVTTTDPCGGGAVVSHDADAISNVICANHYTIRRTYHVTSACGDVITRSQTITVLNTNAPTITAFPADATYGCACSLPAANDQLVSATDACGGVATITHLADVQTNSTELNHYQIVRTYLATDSCGNSASAVQTFTIIAAAPTVAFTHTNYYVVDPLFTISGTTTGDLPVTQVYYSLNGAPFQLAEGTNKWRATMTLPEGTNVVAAYAVDLATNTSPITNAIVVYANVSNLRVVATDFPGPAKTNSGIFTPNLNGQSLNNGKTYSITAVAGLPSHRFVGWATNTSTNTPLISTNATLTFTMQPNLLLVARFENPFFGLTGTWSGLFSESDNISPGSAGFMTITMPGTTDKTVSLFSGKVMLNGGSYPIRGQFDSNGYCHLNVARLGATTLGVDVYLDVVTKTNFAWGTVSTTDWTANLTAYRGITKNDISSTAQYTMAFSPASASMPTPPGWGIGTVKQARTGTLTVSGSLADSIAYVPQVVAPSKDGYWPIFAQLYKKPTGLLWGWLQFSNAQPSGTLYWFRPSGIATGGYPQGFSSSVAVHGSSYTAAAATFNWSNEGAALLYNANTRGVTNKVQVAANTVSIVNDANYPATNKLAVRINAATGLVTGSFFNPTRRGTDLIKGVVLQNYGIAAGYTTGTNCGAFLLQGP